MEQRLEDLTVTKLIDGESFVQWLTRARKLDELLVDISDAFARANETAVEWDYRVEYPMANGVCPSISSGMKKLLQAEMDDEDEYEETLENEVYRLLLPVDYLVQPSLQECLLQVSLADSWLNYDSSVISWSVHGGHIIHWNKKMEDVEL